MDTAKASYGRRADSDSEYTVAHLITDVDKSLQRDGGSVMVVRLVILALAVASLALVGCTSSDHKAGWKAREEVGAIWGVGEQGVDSDLKRVDDSMSESHRMMAIMILTGAGENSDLESYENVYLVDVKTNDGGNTATVVVVENKEGGQKTIVPQAVKDQGSITSP